jgi:hypothetical protein
MWQRVDGQEWKRSYGFVLCTALALGCSSGEEARPAAETVALNVSPSTTDFVIEAQNSVRVQPGGRVSGGDVGARGVAGPFLSGGVALELASGSQIDSARSLIADSVRLGTGVTTGDLQTNHPLFGNGSSHGTVTPLVALPALPPASAVSPGSANLMTATGSTVTAPAFAYATVSVGTGSTLRLPGGTHQWGALALASGARLEAQGPVEIRIAGRLAAAAGGFIGARTGVALTAKDIRIEVSGQNGNSGSLSASPKAATFASGDDVTALLLVPNGTLELGSGAVVRGAVMARDVDVGGSGTRLSFQDGFSPSCTSATCDDGDPCTTDVCGATGCTHEDACGPLECEDVAWQRSIRSSPGSDALNGVATDAAGNIYVAGFSEGIDGNPSAGGYDVLVIKYDAAGNRLWTRLIGNAAYESALAIATAPTGQIYVSGYTMGALAGTNAGGSDAFVLQLDSAGNVGWTRQLGSEYGDTAYGVAADASGNVYIAGETGGNVDGTPRTGGGGELFVAKYDAGGTLAWIRQLASTSDIGESATGRGVATDGSGNVYVTGFTTGGSFDGNAGFGGSDVILAKFDPAGNKLWSRQFGGPDYENAWGVATDHAGNAYVAGRGYGGLDGNPGTLAGGLLLVKYDAAGNRVWTRQHGSAEFASAYAVATDATDGVFVTGETSASMDGHPAGGDGNTDLFVVKYDSAGTFHWSEQQGVPGFDAGDAIATDASGNVYAAGFVQGDVLDDHSTADTQLWRIEPLACSP